MAKENKVATEVAEQEFENWCDTWGIDFDESDFNEEEQEHFISLKKKIIKSIKSGRAVVVNDGESIEYTLRFPKGEIEKLVFEMPEGEAFTAMDKCKPNEFVKKQNQFIASMIKQPPKLLVKLKAVDLKFAQAVSSLFLAS
jgi:hypothetical protein